MGPRRLHLPALLLAPCLIVAARPAAAGQPPVQRPGADAPREAEAEAAGEDEATSDEDGATPAEGEAPPDAAVEGDADAPSSDAQPDTSAEGADAGEAAPAEGAQAPSGEAPTSEAPESGGLPSYLDAPEPEGPAPVDEFGAAPAMEVAPGDGRGRVAAGSILLGGGVVLMGVSSTLIALDEDVVIWGVGLGLGVVAVTSGAVAIAIGKRRQGSYGEWAAQQSDAPPPQGNGLIAAGATCLIGGTFGMIFGGVALLRQDGNDPPYGETMLGVGVPAAAAGALMLGLGVPRHKRFEAWDGERSGYALQVQPNFGPLRGGAQIGVTGQF